MNRLLTAYDAQKDLKHVRDYERELGRATGLATGRIEDILDLPAEYGEIPMPIKETVLTQKDVEILRRWLKIAAGVSSAEEFAE